jgi:hypothetical protein
MKYRDRDINFNHKMAIYPCCLDAENNDGDNTLLPPAEDKYVGLKCIYHNLC